jgi:large subunit ribosomal protein L33
MAKGQEHLIKLVSVGDEKGVGKGHTYYSRKNKKSVERKLELKKYNPIARKHTSYKEKKA